MLHVKQPAWFWSCGLFSVGIYAGKIFRHMPHASRAAIMMMVARWWALLECERLSVMASHSISGDRVKRTGLAA